MCRVVVSSSDRRGTPIRRASMPPRAQGCFAACTRQGGSLLIEHHEVSGNRICPPVAHHVLQLHLCVVLVAAAENFKVKGIEELAGVALQLPSPLVRHREEVDDSVLESPLADMAGWTVQPHLFNFPDRDGMQPSGLVVEASLSVCKHGYSSSVGRKGPGGQTRPPECQTRGINSSPQCGERT